MITLKITIRKVLRYFLCLLALTVVTTIYISISGQLLKPMHLFYKRNSKNYFETEASRRNITTTPFYSKKNLSPLEKAIEKAILISMNINHRKPPVLVTLVNNAYLPFVYSWLCNTKSMNIHSQVLLFVTDSQCLKLQKDWPEVNIILLPKVFSVPGKQYFGYAGYAKLMITRTDIIHRLLLRNVSLLLFEVDCLWISNPIPECQSKLKDNDILGTKVRKEQKNLAGGFLFFSTTRRMKLFWGYLNTQMKTLSKKIAKKKNYDLSLQNEQDYLVTMLNKRLFNIKFSFLPWERYPDGLWYHMSSKERNATDPVLINNNWIAGNDNKLERAKKWGHWFIDDNMKCIEALINKTVQKQKRNR